MFSSNKELALLQPPSKAKTVLKALNARLTELHYDQIQMNLRYVQYYDDPWPIIDDFEKQIQRLSSCQRYLYELLLLGKALPLKTVEASLTRNLTEGLMNIGLLKRDGELFHLGDLAIVSRLGYYFIAELPTKHPMSVYIGKDSYYLTQNFTIPPDSYLLDLCTGTGTQAIIGSARAKRVVGVEIGEKAATIAVYNTILNNVEDKVEIKKGDLFTPVEDQQFDVICSNPPYMAIPPKVNYEIYGNGGQDGLEIFTRLLNGLDDHLVDGGKAVFSGWSIGNEEYPLIIEKLKRLSVEYKWSTTLFITGREYLAFKAHDFAASAINVNEANQDDLVLKWKKMFQDLKVDWGYGYIIFIDKLKKARFNIINTSNPWTLNDKPKLTEQVDFKKSEYYSALVKNKSISISKSSFDILNLCKGNKTVDEVIREYFSSPDNAFFSSFYVDRTFNDMLELFNLLEKNGIIEREKQVQLPDKKNEVPIFKRVKDIFR